jgi:hypothetical protein
MIIEPEGNGSEAVIISGVLPSPSLARTQKRKKKMTSGSHSNPAL